MGSGREGEGVPPLWLVCVGGVALASFMWTLAPDISYFVDSAEYVLTITTLGVAHPPGYPLLMLAGHVWARLLPFGEVALRLNALSAVTLAAAAPLTAAALYPLLRSRALAVGGGLAGVWGYYVWVTATSIEIYAPQVAALAALAWSLSRLVGRPSLTRADLLLSGALLGLAVAVHPVNALFVPGTVLAWRLLGARLPHGLAALVLGGLLAIAPLVYFPVRGGPDDGFTVVGTYAADGTFTRQDLRSVGGLLYYVTGRQFEGYFFAEGVVPSGGALLLTARLFAENYLYIGALAGLVGLWQLGTARRGVLAVWAAWFLPYTYFFTAYGADDKITMFGPALWLFVLPVMYGFDWFTDADGANWQRVAIAVAFAGLLFGVNGRNLRAARSDDLVTLAASRLAAYPPGAVVVGPWTPIVQLHYAQQVGGTRPAEADLYNLDSIGENRAALAAFLDDAAAGQPVVFVGLERFPPELAAALRATGLRAVPFETPPTLAMGEALRREFIDYDGDTPAAGYLLTSPLENR